MPSPERASQERCKFQLQWGVMSIGKKVDQSMVFGQNLKNLIPAKKDTIR